MRSWRLWITLIGLSLVAMLALKLPATTAQARAGTAFAARMGCGCVFIDRRSVDSCKTDFEPGMRLVGLDVDRPGQRVTASVPLLARRSAHVGPTGCVLD